MFFVFQHLHPRSHLVKNQVYFQKREGYRSLSVVSGISSAIKEVSLVYYEPNLVMPMHTHSVGQFSTMLMGQSIERNLKVEFDTHHGLVEFKPIAYQHSNMIGPSGAIFLSINIDSEHEDFMSEYGRLEWIVSDTKLASQRWRNLLTTLLSDRAAQTVDLEERVLSLLDTSLSTKHAIKIAPQWLKLAEQAVIETQMSVTDIAQSVGVHRVHLCRVFQNHFGLSVSQFRHRAMLQKSLVGMITNKLNISSASADSGFADQSHFTRTMKQQFGITPLKMRNLFAPRIA